MLYIIYSLVTILSKVMVFFWFLKHRKKEQMFAIFFLFILETRSKYCYVCKPNIKPSQQYFSALKNIDIYNIYKKGYNISGEKHPKRR